MKTEIISISAKNVHKSLAAWCLKAYCDKMGFEDVNIIETNINDNLSDILGKIFAKKPDVAAFSCYIWNIEYISKICTLLKKLLPETKIVLGGPEVWFETNFENYPFADYIIKGSGEKAFLDLLSCLKNNLKTENIISCSEANFENYPSSFTNEYFNSFSQNQIPNIVNQLVYYESSRGCPFSCSYCLSSAIDGVQYLDIKRVETELLLLVEKGAKCIKFVDRTFNANKKRALQILQFVKNLKTDCVFHFEVAADLFDEDLLSVMEYMPIGRVQFEIGIQSVHEPTLAAINRKTNLKLCFDNIKKLVSNNNCHIHLDLIAGLPHETLFSFSQGINFCLSAKPHMLQLGFLKMLKGTKLLSQSKDFDAVFSPCSPYEVFQTSTLSFDDILHLKKIENLIERFYNSGAFANTFWYAVEKFFDSPYELLFALAKFCPDNYLYRVSMKNAYTLLLDFLLPFGNKDETEHYIRLDCLSFDIRGMLPQNLKPLRNKAAEQEYKQSLIDKTQNFRIEYFPFDNTHKLFLYDKKDSITNKFFYKDFTV